MSCNLEFPKSPPPLFERFRQSKFFIETVERAKKGNEKGYEEFVQGLADEFLTVSKQTPLEPGFNYVYISDQVEEISHLDILLADDKRKPVGMIKLCPIENPLPEDFEAVLTTSTYIDPRFRRQGLTKKLLLEAHLEAKSIYAKYAETDKPVAFFEQLAMPNTPQYRSLRERMAAMLISVGYSPLDKDAGFFIKLVS